MNPSRAEAMAIRSAESRSEKAFYDPFYMPREGHHRIKCDETPCRFFDDFSVANHIHILKPQMGSVTVSSVLQNNEKSPQLMQTRNLLVERDEEEQCPDKQL